MSLTLGRTKFEIRVLYKSGNSQSFWCTEFKTDTDLSKVEWTSINGVHPIVIRVDNIEAVWQTEYKVNLFRAIWTWMTGWMS